MSSDENPSAQRRPVRILLVEDNPADIRLTREMFRESKIRNDLIVAADAEEAERMLGLAGGEATEARPDLMLLDLNLPGKDGHELLEEVKSHPDLRRIPVVVLTSSEAEEDIVKSYDHHANAFVTKPVGLDGLSSIVAAIDEFWFEVVRLTDD